MIDVCNKWDFRLNYNLDEVIMKMNLLIMLRQYT